jgi:hypothetical protein
MNRWIIYLSIVLLSWQCAALCTRGGPEGPKGEQQAPSTPVAVYKWINSSCIEFDGVILCSSQHVAHQVFNDVTHFMTSAAEITLMLVILGVLVWCFWTVPGLFYFWLKAQFISVFVLGAITVPSKTLSFWGWFIYWCVYASVWQSLNMVLDWSKRVWRDTIVPAWKDPACIANLKLE